MAIERQIRCPKCFKMMCKLVDVGQTRMVYLKHRKLKAVALRIVITCPGCRTTCRVGPDGIEDKQSGTDPIPIQSENAG